MTKTDDTVTRLADACTSSDGNFETGMTPPETVQHFENIARTIEQVDRREYGRQAVSQAPELA